MCGIYFCYHHQANKTITQDNILENLNIDDIKRRGPDETRHIVTDNMYCVFCRLGIVGNHYNSNTQSVAPNQPFTDNNTIVLCNGEIYNYKKLNSDFNLKCKTKSDCEVILQLYNKVGIYKMLTLIEGEFAFVIYDMKRNVVHFARDRLGRKSLYYNLSKKYIDSKYNILEISSQYNTMEIKGPNSHHVMPRLLYTYDISTDCIATMEYYTMIYQPKQQVNNLIIYDAFVAGIKARLMQTDRPVGFLLSGGFDSSLILSISLELRLLKYIPHVFTIGFEENAPDVVSAGLMISFLKEKYGEDCLYWHKVIYDVKQAIDTIPQVIQAIETYDTTTIRASTPMYMISKYISENTNVKVLMSGEGADELFGGYMYFRYSPNAFAFKSEVIKLLNELYLFDVLRADKVTSAHGLEVRTPFLDDRFVKCVLSSIELKGDPITTKAYLRDLVRCKSLLPMCILNGRKEAFSDAVGYSWISSIIDYTNKLDIDIQHISDYIEPHSKETKYYQNIFCALFGNNSWHLCKKLWLPNQNWVKTGNEPSATVLTLYQAK